MAKTNGNVSVVFVSTIDEGRGDFRDNLLHKRLLKKTPFIRSWRGKGIQGPERGLDSESQF